MLKTIVEACTVRPLPPLMARAGTHREEAQGQRGVEGGPHPATGNQTSSVKENLTESLKGKVIVAVRGHRHQAHPVNLRHLDHLQEVEHLHQIVHQEETLHHQSPTERHRASITSPETAQMTNAHSYTLEEEEGVDPLLDDPRLRPR
jgi:hypothetical protein